jgi:integrase
MGTVHKLSTNREQVTVADAVAAYLAVIDHPESRGTRRTYAIHLAAFAAQFGQAAVAGLDPAQVAGWFTSKWGGRSPATWNGARSALRAAAAYWDEQGWAAADPTAQIRRRTVAVRRDRALSREQIELLLTREDISLRDKTLWRLLYESAARSAEVLRLDVEDLDLANRRARVRRKGGAIDVIVWQTGTARLLPRLLKGRKSGPVFLTERRARVQLPPADLDPASGRARLSYGQAEAIFKAASGGATLHQLRHSALTHDAEEGTGTPMLQARSGHTSLRSLERYTRVSAEALARHQAERDPARRR